jgi:hypothetical protein
MWLVCLSLFFDSFADINRDVSEDLFNTVNHRRISVLKIIMLVISVVWIPAEAMAWSRPGVKVSNIRRAF